MNKARNNKLFLFRPAFNASLSLTVSALISKSDIATLIGVRSTKQAIALTRCINISIVNCPISHCEVGGDLDAYPLLIDRRKKAAN